MSRARAKLAEECDIHPNGADCPLIKQLESEF
jgi:hypothetical protein